MQLNKIVSSVTIYICGTFLFCGCWVSNNQQQNTQDSTLAKYITAAGDLRTLDKPILKIDYEEDSLATNLPAVQSAATAAYQNYWIVIGGMKAGAHSIGNSPPPFQTKVRNDSIWVIDIANHEAYGVPVPQQYYYALTTTNPAFYQSGNTLYFCGGYGTKDASSPQYNYTSDYFFQVDIPSLVQYVLPGGEQPALSQVFPKVIESPFVQVTGGEMIVVNNNFYLVGGQNYTGVYLPGTNGVYTNAIRKFNLAQSNTDWIIADTASLIDTANLHRRDFNLATVFASETDSVRAMLLGGVFTKKGLAYRNPVLITGLASGNMAIKADTMQQQVNQYSSARINISLVLDDFHLNMISLIGGITYMQYDTAQKQLTIPRIGFTMPYSNMITSVLTDANFFFNETIQLPPLKLLPAFIGASATFFPLGQLTKDGYADVIDLTKVPLLGTGNKVQIGYLYGGIFSPAANTFTPSGNYTTTVNNKIYKIYLAVY